MLSTYKAILKGNQIIWQEKAPQTLSKEQEICVHITLLEEIPTQKQGAEMASALNRLAQQREPNSFGDPVSWQRETRKENDLFGRGD